MPAALQGRRIVVTRPRPPGDQADELTRDLQDHGADVVRFPVTRIEPEPDLDALRAALTAPGRYRWILFTSQNAVQVVWDRLETWGLRFAETPVAAIGPGTAAALRRHGVSPALVPDDHVAESLLRRLLETGGLPGAHVLLPTARAAREVLPEGLRAAGAIVDVIPVYRTIRETDPGPVPARALATRLLAGSIDAVTFTASSAVRHFVELVGPEAATAPRFLAAVIGPVTAATARELRVSGADPLEASPFTIPGLVEALCRRFS